MNNPLQPAASHLSGSKSDKFEGYLIFDFQEFQGLVSQPDSNQNDDRSLSDSKALPRTAAQTMNPQIGISSSLQNPQRFSDTSKKFTEYNQGLADQDNDNKKISSNQLQGMDYLEKTKDKTNYDEFYTFLMGLDFLNISNTRNRVDPILMDQFKSLMEIKEYFMLLKNHIDRITENDSDLWFDELKNTFKLMLHQFENMINSISEQINPVSLSVCFFRCIEYIKIFQRFLHMRTFHQQNIKGDITPALKFRRSVQLCLLWKRLTYSKTFDQLIHYMDSEPFNCGYCEKCKRDNQNQMISQFQQALQDPQSNLQILKLNSQSDPSNGRKPTFRKHIYYNAKIFKDIELGFAKIVEKDIQFIKTYERKNEQSVVVGQNSKTTEFILADRGKSFRHLISPVSKSSDINQFYLSWNVS